jgi:hypothetical protein
MSKESWRKNANTFTHAFAVTKCLLLLRLLVALLFVSRKLSLDQLVPLKKESSQADTFLFFSRLIIIASYQRSNSNMQFKKSLLLCLGIWGTASTASALVTPPVQHTKNYLSQQNSQYAHNTAIRGGAASKKKSPLTKLKGTDAVASQGDGEATIPNEG